MQKLPKISPSKSSLLNSPVISPRAAARAASPRRKARTPGRPSGVSAGGTTRSFWRAPARRDGGGAPPAHPSRRCGSPRGFSSARAAGQGPRRSSRSRRSAAAPRFVGARCGAAQIDLVENQGHRHIGRQPRARPSTQRLLVGGGIDDEQHAVGARHFACARRMPSASTASPPRAGPRCRAHSAACRRCMCSRSTSRVVPARRDDRRLVAGEAVEEARLAGIRPAGDDHRHAFAQQPPCRAAGTIASKCSRTAWKPRRAGAERKSISSSGKSMAAST